MKRKILCAAVLIAVASHWGIGRASADSTTPTTNGTWAAHPGQSTSYQAVILPPINSDGTSNWSAKSKGAIPIMFKLSSGLGPFVFESIYADGTDSNPATTNDSSFLSFTPSSPVTFNDITELSALYEFTLDDCHGGSLRWQVRTSISPLQAVFIYYGNPPNFGTADIGGCTSSANGGVDQNGINVIGLADLRYDTSQYAGGTFYDTYEHTKTLIGTTPIIRASLVLDSGWQYVIPGDGDQRLTLSSATFSTADFTDIFIPQLPTPSTATCNLPQATLKITRLDPQPDGEINEAPVQQSFDQGNIFRVVDCKYQYNLSVPSLPGAGTYKVEIQIGGFTVGYAKFDLK